MIDWSAAADSSTTALIDYYWNADKGFFNATTQSEGNYNYWPQAHAMDVIIDAYLRTGDTKYSDMFDKWFTGCRLQNHTDHTVFTNDYYDDEAWMALTMTRLYNVTKEDKYLTVAKDLYEDIKGGWNTEYQNGGIAWRKSQPWTKGACINGPASLLAFKLCDITGDDSYAQFGLQVYEWIRENIMEPSTGEVYDGVDGTTGELTYWNFTYNQGSVMAAALAAYRYTGDQIYLKDARRCANFTITSSKFLDSSINVIMRENGGTPDSGDGGLFRAVFFRYFCDVVESSEFDSAWHKKFNACFNSSAEYLWRNGIVDKRWVLFSNNWSSGIEVGGLGYLNPQISACAVIELKARLAAEGI